MMILGDGFPPFYRAMTMGTLFIHWSARVAFLLYAAALAAWLLRKPRAARLTWTFGFLVFLTHVAAAFQWVHHWSHSAAYEETALQTAALLGVNSGVGLYCNYAFSAVWALDVIWLLGSAETYRRRPLWIAVAIHGFMAFMFFNATVVFVTGWVRWLGAIASLALGVLWLRTRQR
jgi:hypothetical protein